MFARLSSEYPMMEWPLYSRVGRLSHCLMKWNLELNKLLTYCSGLPPFWLLISHVALDLNAYLPDFFFFSSFSAPLSCSGDWSQHWSDMNHEPVHCFSPRIFSGIYFSVLSSCNMILFVTNQLPCCFLSQNRRHASPGTSNSQYITHQWECLLVRCGAVHYGCCRFSSLVIDYFSGCTMYPDLSSDIGVYNGFKSDSWLPKL